MFFSPLRYPKRRWLQLQVEKGEGDMRISSCTTHRRRRGEEKNGQVKQHAGNVIKIDSPQSYISFPYNDPPTGPIVSMPLSRLKQWLLLSWQSLDRREAIVIYPDILTLLASLFSIALRSKEADTEYFGPTFQDTHWMFPVTDWCEWREPNTLRRLLLWHGAGFGINGLLLLGWKM